MTEQLNISRKNNTGIIFSDLYNAQIFQEKFKDKIKWCKDYGGWFIFNDRFWQKDNNDTIKKYAIFAYADIAFNMKEFNTDVAYNHMRRSASNGALNAMVECSKPFLGCESKDFDNNDLLINCENGIFDLSSMSFAKHDARFLITKTAHVAYRMIDDCLLWKNFLNEIFLADNEVIEYIQRVIGYSMTALTTEQCMFILYGHGRNGKSIFLETISSILGDYAINCPSSTFVQKQNPGIPNDVARLKGSRFACASETNQNVNIDEELIKQLTGNKMITARFLNKEFFDFRTTFKIFLATNHKPNIRGTDVGIWRRIQMIPFELNVTEAKEDRGLAKKLMEEKSGILNWMIEGYKKYNKYGLNTPDKIKRATQLYREEEDDIGQFIKNECLEENGGFISTQEFKNKFFSTMGYHKGAKTLSEYMTRHGHKPHGDNKIWYHGKQQRGYVNIRFMTEIDKNKDSLGWKEDNPSM